LNKISLKITKIEDFSDYSQFCIVQRGNLGGRSGKGEELYDENERRKRYEAFEIVHRLAAMSAILFLSRYIGMGCVTPVWVA